MKNAFRKIPPSLATKSHRWTAAFSGIVVAVFMALMPNMASAENAGIVSITVKGSFEDTSTKLKKAITRNKLIIVKEVPFTKMLGMVGVKAEKIKGFEIFHPRYGKVLHASDTSAFLEAPLRLMLREKAGAIEVSYRKPSVVFSGYSGLSELGKSLDQVFENIVGSLAK